MEKLTVVTALGTETLEVMYVGEGAYGVNFRGEGIAKIRPNSNKGNDHTLTMTDGRTEDAPAAYVAQRAAVLYAEHADASHVETPAPSPAFIAPRTYAVSEYRKDGALVDTEYRFSNGENWKIIEAREGERNRSVKRQEFEGDHYRRAPLATLKGLLKHHEQVGETELLDWDAYVADSSPVEMTVINHDAPAVILDPLLPVLDAVEIPETPAEPEAETVTFTVMILKRTPDRVTARIIALGMRTDARLARNLIVSRIAAKMRRNGASDSEISAERKRYMLDAVVINDDLTTGPGVSNRTYTVDTIDGKHSPIIKHDDGTREVTIAGLERHLPAPAPATPPSPEHPITPAGKTVADVPYFDRSIKVVFKCPEHEAEVYMSKDPYSSSWFPAHDGVHGCPKECKTATRDHILTQDYRPTRRG